MNKLELNPQAKRKQLIKAFKDSVSNDHTLFDGTIRKPFLNTPDRIFFMSMYSYTDDEAVPFVYLTFNDENQVFFGGRGETHYEIYPNIHWYLFNKGYKMSDITGDPNHDEAYNNMEFQYRGEYIRNEAGNPKIVINGRYYLINIPELNNKKCVVFTFWELDRIPMDKINDIVYTISKKRRLFDRDIYIANGTKPLIHYNEFTPGDKDEFENNSEQHIAHMLPAKEKHEVTADFRNTRDKMWGQKLTKRDGSEMPMAQYRALKYVDEDYKPSKRRIYLTESQVEEIKKELEKARKETNTNPTEKQKEAGNYKMGRVNIYGFEIAIENPKGSYRRGKDKNGKAWEVLMKNDYGYFTHTKAIDGDAVDVFLGKDLDCKTIFAIDQKLDGKFDETKVMFGFKTEDEAKKAYLSNYNKGWKGFWRITEVSMEDFKEWLYDGYKQRKPFSEYNEIKKKKLNESVDFYKKEKLILGDDTDYVHVIDEEFDSIISEYEEKPSIPFLTKESIDEVLDDGDLGEVLQSFDVQKKLNPKFWVDNKLNSRVRLRLLDIADSFFDSMEVNWVKPKDIIMTGSLANYNWSKYSDIDLHIVVDFKDVDDRTEFVKDYFDSKKTIWNNAHEDLKIYGFPVELYVQDENEEHTASGVYSLEKNKWLKEPERDDLAAVKLNKERITHKTKTIVDKIDKLDSECNGEKDTKKLDTLSEKVKKLFDSIKGMRKDSLKNGSEMSEGNVIFKILRRLGYIGKIVDLKRLTFDKINSIK